MPTQVATSAVSSQDSSCAGRRIEGVATDIIITSSHPQFLPEAESLPSPADGNEQDSPKVDSGGQCQLTTLEGPDVSMDNSANDENRDSQGKSTRNFLTLEKSRDTINR